MRRILLPALALSLGACSGKDGDSGTTVSIVDSGEPELDCDPETDRDCDGVPDADDCLPSDPLAYPGATEIPYDGVDNDCAGDGDLTDVDGDGYDSDAVGGDDCNDGNAEAYPGAPETCNGRDDDCDGFPASPEEETDDCDGDGYGPGPGGDCDDEDASVYPGAEDTWYDGVDSDCASDDDYDADGDGDRDPSGGGSDCDDTDPNTYDAAVEVIDGRDNDCDGAGDVLTQRDASASFFGTTSSGDGWTGIDIAVVDDYDGDGRPEWLLAGPLSELGNEECDLTMGANLCAGWVHIMPGDAESTDPPSTVALGTLAGNAGSAAWFGFSVARLDDLDGDGLSEVGIGSPFDGNGAVYVFASADVAGGGTLGPSDALATLRGASLLGLDVAATLDADGDGLGEVVASTGFNDISVGASSAWAGVYASADVLAGGTLNTSDAAFVFQGDGAGGEVSGLVDFDGDGLGDLVVADQTASAGRLYFASSADIALGGTVGTGELSGPGGETGDGLGAQLSVAGDINGDGYPELAAAAPGAMGAASVAEGGVVYVISGDSLASATSAATAAFVTVEGTENYGRLSTTGPEGGDFDADGTPDLLVSAIGGSSVSIIRPAIHVFLGPTLAGGGTLTPADAVASVNGLDGDRFGFGGAVGDLDADGADDVLLGAFLGSAERGIGTYYLTGF